MLYIHGILINYLFKLFYQIFEFRKNIEQIFRFSEIY